MGSARFGVRLSPVSATTVPAAGDSPDTWPEFREYSSKKYGSELDDDLITMIEGLIERRRDRRYGRDKG